MKDLTLTGPAAAAEKPPARSRLLGLIDRGRALAKPLADLFLDFLKTPAQVVIDTALSVSKAFSGVGLVPLTPEQRQQVGLQISDAACKLAHDTANAAQRSPEVEAAAGVTGKGLHQLLAQEDELAGLARVLMLLRRSAQDMRWQLQTWQWEAQQRILGALVQELTAAPTLAARLELCGEAGPVLDSIEVQLLTLRGARDAGAAQSEEAAAEQAALDEDLFLLQTMRAIRDGQPVDEAALSRAAAHYRRRNPGPVGPANPEPAVAGPAPAKKKAATKKKPKDGTVH